MKTKSPELTVIEGGKTEPLVSLITPPEEAKFVCWSCNGSCRMFPSQRPMSVQHSLPVCAEWLRIVGKHEDIERFLIKSGVELLVPEP